MRIQNLLSSPVSPGAAKKPFDWLAIFIVALSLLLSVIIAYTVGQIGFLALLAIPAMLAFIGAIGKPEWGLVGFLVITFTQLSDVLIVYHHLPSIAQPLAALLLVVIVIRIAVFGEQPLGWLRAGVFLLIYTTAWLISLLHASDAATATTTFIGFAKDALGMLIVVYFIQSPSTMRHAFWALIVAGIFMGTITAFQYFTSSYGNVFWGFGGWEQQISGAVTRYRITGPYANPNAYAQVMVVISALALDRVWHERKTLPKLVAGWSLVVSVLAVFVTFSRGGFISLVFTISVLLIQRRFNFIPLLITALIGLGLVQFLPDTYSSRINSLLQLVPSSTASPLSDPSFVGRLSENTVAYRMFLDDPFLGVGLGNYRVLYQDYSRHLGLDTRRVSRTPASLYLEILSEQGLVGSIVFVILIVYIFAGLVKARRNFSFAGMRDEAFMTSAILAGMAGYMFEAIFKNSAYSNAFWVLVGVALAVIQVAQLSFNKAIEQADSPVRQLA